MLLGRVSPSGKTNDTWAKDLTDYPSTAGWDQKDQAYTEDIFVGYRWFETFDPDYEKVHYEFGFGLSYTSFRIETNDFAFDGDTVSVNAVVTNTGSTAGKEVVQMYVSAPQGDGGMGLCFMGTAYPCNAILSCTWNDALAEAFGLLLGAELYKNNVGMWLGPPVNMRRNPLAGRNLEYYSEDPFVSGRFASIIIKAVQRNGIPVCIKHLVCNEKEAGKIWSDSQVSERALREIYLKPFEMGIKEGHAEGIMTSYNVMNGLPTSENADMLRGIIRGEWGIHGGQQSQQ